MTEKIEIMYIIPILVNLVHVDDSFKFKRYHKKVVIKKKRILERYNQQNFVLNTIWMIIPYANIVLFEAILRK